MSTTSFALVHPSDPWVSLQPTRPLEEEFDVFDDVDILFDTFFDSLVDTTDPPPTERPPTDPPPTERPPTDRPKAKSMASVEPTKLPFTQGTVYASLRNNECLHCGKTFKRSEHLKIHIRAIHHNIKEFHCPVCAKAFVTQSGLAVHMRVHNDERPFACSWPGCDKRFRQKMHMNRHTRVHTGKKPFVCNVCKRAFSQASSMKRHMRKLHAGATISLLGA